MQRTARFLVKENVATVAAGVVGADIGALAASALRARTCGTIVDGRSEEPRQERSVDAVSLCHAVGEEVVVAAGRQPDAEGFRGPGQTTGVGALFHR